jgi:hypothetical protein
MTTSVNKDQPAERATDLSRRRVLSLAIAAAAGAATRPVDWVFALEPGGAIVKRAQTAGEAAYRPVLFSPDELEAVARLCDVIIPRTTTPGARDARVHEYIDLALSVEDQDEQAEIRRGFERLDRASRSAHSQPLHQASPEQIAALLTPLSDEVTAAGPSASARDLSPGAAFFASIKRRTVFGYYTSREGRVEELGLPEAITMERWRGCQHAAGDADHGGGRE